MQVTEIAYREMKNLGNYNNVTIEIKAVVNPEDDLEMCLAKLKAKVKRELKQHRSEE